jgi:hypothetical protein
MGGRSIGHHRQPATATAAMPAAFAREGFGNADSDSDNRNHEQGKHRFKGHRCESVVAPGAPKILKLADRYRRLSDMAFRQTELD